MSNTDKNKAVKDGQNQQAKELHGSQTGRNVFAGIEQPHIDLPAKELTEQELQEKELRVAREQQKASFDRQASVPLPVYSGPTPPQYVGSSTPEPLSKDLRKPAVRTLFKCDYKQVNNYYGGTDVILSPVYAGSPENKGLFKATPSGILQLTTLNDAAAAPFTVGKEYFIDITPV